LKHDYKGTAREMPDKSGLTSCGNHFSCPRISHSVETERLKFSLLGNSLPAAHSLFDLGSFRRLSALSKSFRGRDHNERRKIMELLYVAGIQNEQMFYSNPIDTTMLSNATVAACKSGSLLAGSEH
jgi:hypothetical protein